MSVCLKSFAIGGGRRRITMVSGMSDEMRRRFVQAKDISLVEHKGFPAVIYHARQGEVELNEIIKAINMSNVGESNITYVIQTLIDGDGDGDGDGDEDEHNNATQRDDDAQTDHSSAADASSDIPYRAAIAAAGQGHNIVMLGPPGTGKTNLLMRIGYHLMLKGKRVLLLSSTSLGLCAFLTCGVVKPPGDNVPDLEPQIMSNALGLWMGATHGINSMIKGLKLFNKKARDNWRETDVLLIDNISMVPKETMDLITQAAYSSKVRGAPNPPQFILAGDFTRGQPYKNDPVTKKYVQQKYAFDSSAWQTLNLQIFTLNISYRHEGDQHLGRIVRRLYHSVILDDEDRTRLQNRVVRSRDVNTGKFARSENKPTPQHMRIYLRNNQANEYNQSMQSVLMAEGRPMQKYEAYIDYVVVRQKDLPIEKIKFQNTADLTFRFPESISAVKDVHTNIVASLTLHEFTLCVGSRVMLTETVGLSCGLVAGTCGIVIAFTDDGLPRVEFFSERQNKDDDDADLKPVTIIVKPVPYVGFNSKHTFEVVMRQVPLRLAWALTIQNAVGMSFDKAIVYFGRNHGFGGHCVGKALEAIGHVRTLDGLLIDMECQGPKGVYQEELNVESLFHVDPVVINFHGTAAVDEENQQSNSFADAVAQIEKLAWIKEANADPVAWAWIPAAHSRRNINNLDNPRTARQALGGRPPMIEIGEAWTVHVADQKKKRRAIEQNKADLVAKRETKRRKLNNKMTKA